MSNPTQNLQTGRIHSPVKGMFWICLSMACFSIINIFVKNLSQDLTPSQIAFFQNFFALFFLLPFIISMIAAQKKVSFLKTKRPLLHISRILASAIGVLIWYTGIAALPKVAQAVALVQTGPFFSILGAKFFLKESIGKERLLMTIIGFIGAMVIIQPHSIEFGIYSFLPLIAAACFSASSLMARSLSSTESPEKMVLYLLLFMTPATLIPALSDWHPVASDAIAKLCALGGFAALAHYALTKAYQMADAGFLSPFGFSKFPITAIIAFFAFGQTPDTTTLYGASIIILAAFYITKFDVRKESKTKNA